MKNILKVRIKQILNQESLSENKYIRIKIIEKLLDSQLKLSELKFDDIYNILCDLEYNEDEILDMISFFI